MKKIAIITLLLMVASNSNAKDIETVKDVISVPMAVEFIKNNKFNNIIARLELDYGYGESISIITFMRAPFNEEHILPLPTIYKITHKDKRGKKNYYIEGINQYGTKITGIIDGSIETKPKVDLLLGDIKITNISNDGRKFRDKYISNIDLGWEY